jgi:hypothetical protein
MKRRGVFFIKELTWLWCKNSIKDNKAYRFLSGVYLMLQAQTTKIYLEKHINIQIYWFKFIELKIPFKHVKIT